MMRWENWVVETHAYENWLITKLDKIVCKVDDNASSESYEFDLLFQLANITTHNSV